jgi:hypothetical protein
MLSIVYDVTNDECICLIKHRNEGVVVVDDECEMECILNI